MKRLIIAAALVGSACGNPIAPDTTECVKATRFDTATQQYVDYGTLVPRSQVTSAMVVEPRTECK